MQQIGIVIIGRNEGHRLHRCLASLQSHIGSTVYVDSGSTDASVGLARSVGADVIELDTTIPFTAARARNEGFRRLLRTQPALRYVQFIDGDCEVVAGWLEMAFNFLEANAGYAIAAGRRRERDPQASIYNSLCDCEWDTPIGDANACGGDAMIRVNAFTASGGYNDDVIAGEEPELCVRLRAAGWRISRLDCDMTLHDAAMLRFSQWWRRSMRAGFAYALGASMHGRAHGHWVRECTRIWIWAAILPLLAVSLFPLTRGVSSLLLLGYPLTGLRAMQWRRRRGDATRVAAAYGFFCVIGKWAELVGQMKFLLGRLRRSPMTLIEYKTIDLCESAT